MATPLISESNHEEANGRMPDWRELIAILIERAWLGVFVALVVFSFFYLQLKRTVPQYRSTAVMILDLQSPRPLSYQDGVARSVRNIEYFNTVVKTLHSRAILEKAVSDASLVDSPAFFPGVTNLVDKARAARGLVSIEPVEKSRLINITVEYSDPQVASDLADAVAHAYIEQELDSRMSSSMQAVDWLQRKSAEYRDSQKKGMLALQEYRENLESVSLEEDQNIVISKLKTLNNALTKAQIELVGVESKWTAVKAQVERGVPLEQLTLELNAEELDAALSAWRAQQRKVTQLRHRYKEDWPELKDAVKVEQDLRAHLQEACDLAVDALKSRYDTLVRTETGLKKALQKQEQKAFSLARQLVRYNELKWNVEADQEIYTSMVEQMREMRVAETLPTDVIRLAEGARPAARPFRPVATKVLTRGAILGVVLGVGVIFALYFGDHRFRRNEEVERALGVPVLSSLPHIDGASDHERGMYCHLHTTGEVPEAFRTLRTITQVLPELQDAKVLMVTSTQSGEGKSLVATNLAISFAQDGRKTLLMGADLRRPAFKGIFDVTKMPKGLAEVLDGKASLHDVIDSDLVPGLDVLPAGGIPSNPAELIGNPAMARVIDEVRDHYEGVIIDSSPLLGISDSLLLMRHADGILFVLRQGVTHSLGASHAVRRIHETRTPCLGAVMNGVNLKSLSNYYYYRRYGGYEYRQYQSAPEEPTG